VSQTSDLDTVLPFSVIVRCIRNEILIECLSICKWNDVSDFLEAVLVRFGKQ
jgi:hypothetical protein